MSSSKPLGVALMVIGAVGIIFAPLMWSSMSKDYFAVWFAMMISIFCLIILGIGTIAAMNHET